MESNKNFIIPEVYVNIENNEHIFRSASFQTFSELAIALAEKRGLFVMLKTFKLR